MNIKASDIVKITLAPFLIYMLNYAMDSLWHSLYLAQGWDTYFHLIGGMSMAGSSLVALGLVERLGWVKINRAIVAFFLVVALVISAAVIWEFYEFWHDYFYGTHFQPSNADTMKDLFMGTVGGVAWYLGHFIRKRSAL